LRPPRRRSCWNCQSLAWVCYSSAFPANWIFVSVIASIHPNIKLRRMMNWALELN
jgi:hypothetical protein